MKKKYGYCRAHDGEADSIYTAVRVLRLRGHQVWRVKTASAKHPRHRVGARTLIGPELMLLAFGPLITTEASRAAALAAAARWKSA